MDFATFSDGSRKQWASILAEPKAHEHRALRALISLLDLPLETLLMILEASSPACLIVMGQTCRTFRHHLATRPGIWARARACIGAPAPATLIGHSLAAMEKAWATELFVGALDACAVVPPQWLQQYSEIWNIKERENRLRVKQFLREPPFAALQKTPVTFQEIMRTPTCQKLVHAFRRDLRVVDLASWTLALPFMLRELGLIASCTPSSVPRAFRFHDLDRIICPVCYPFSDAFRLSMDHLPCRESKKRWFAANTVNVESLNSHFFEKHSELLFGHDCGQGLDIIPQIPLYTYCTTCLHASDPSIRYQASRKPFTSRGLIWHERDYHGPVNPGVIYEWFMPQMWGTQKSARNLHTISWYDKYACSV
ncbi:uncharacterized protein SCHCODRAFT_02504324 [Schizophyllum commune H4-8]|nr:uncharacterized protein SCHCODRAFT_02504324 [Schizophyllum commune H4-8]KAI5891493.1 hypothetical protein SCHCODRAFT_02504324 [Schizophyllum commune H4-8]